MRRAALIFLIAAAVAVPATATPPLIPIASTGFDDIAVTVTRLSDRVALFHTTGGSEPTMIVGIESADGIVVVDTERSPSFTAAIREAIEAEMSGDIVYLINTHGHGDHIAGNQVFTDATIIAHENAAAEMREVAQAVEGWSQRLQPAIEVWQAQYESLDEGSQEAVALASRISYHEQWLAGLGPEFELTLPDRTFSDRLVLDLGDLTLELTWFGRAHTQGDILIYCPEEKLLLVGDLFYSEGLPYVDSERIPYLQRWHETLDELVQREEGIERIITGHEEELPLSHLDAIVDFIAEQEALFAGRDSALFAFRDLHEAEGIEVALLRLKEMNAQPGEYYVLYPELDSYAFRLMLAEELNDAHMMFMVLAELFPESDVAFDSLGEVYVRLGNTEAAIAAFEKSLDLNPDNRNALERLKVLKGSDLEPTPAQPLPALALEEVPFGYRTSIASEHLGEAREVFIRLPKSYSEQQGPDASRYPVLYVLDGGDYFESFAGVAEFMAMYEAAPEMIIVAVPHDDRMSELTFTPANEEYGEWPTSGGAEPFQRFLAEELIPAIDDSYRTFPFRILAGHSLGGLFAVESMARSPNLFQATIAMSPSFTWNQFEWLDQAEAMFGDMPAWKHFLIVTEEPKSEEQARRVQEFEKIVKAEAPAGFEYRHARFPDENHGTMALPGLYHSLKQLFDGWALVGEAWQIGPDGVRAHYEGLAERYGFAVPIPEDYLVGHALHGLHSHDAPDEAIALLEFCLELYPDSAAAREALEEAYAYKEGQDGSPQEASAEPLTVWYLGHSGFAVGVGEKLLVFDYWSSGGTPSRDPEAGGLTDGIIEAADLEGLEVYVFVSHSHSDHYDPTILEWESDVDNITYFFGWDAGDNPEHHYFVEPRATAEVDGIEVYTIYSHHSGVAEVAYLVHVDDRWIYHNGDYLQDYIPDFQYLESLTDHLDLVFTGGSHDERWQYTHQVQYLLEHFHPEVLFPMHYGDEEEKGDEFARVMKERGYETVIPVPRARGDRWVIER